MLTRLLLTFLSAMLIAAPSFAQQRGGSHVSRGNFLRIPQYQTGANTTFEVNGSTGSDTNDCLSVSTPCATFPGVLAKIPKQVQNIITVNVASGNYAGFTMFGYYPNPIDPANGPYIDIIGTLINATVATGTATGTATGGTAGSTTTYGTLTDSGQSWTVNNLKGKIIEITGGTGSGQTRVIASNTATAITIVGTWTAPVAASSTYAVRDQGVVINTALNQPAMPGTAAGTPLAANIQGNGQTRNSSTSSGSFIRFSRIRFAPGTAGQSAVQVRDSSVGFFESTISGNTTGTGLALSSGAQVIVGVTYLSSGSTNALNIGSTLTSIGTPALTSNNSLYEAAGGPVATISGAVTFSNNQFNSTANTGNATVASATTAALTGTFTNTVITCTSGGSTVGLNLSGVNSSDSSGTYTTGANATVSVRMTAATWAGCPTGIRVLGGNAALGLVQGSSFTLTGNSTGTGLQALKGGRITISTAPTVTSYTNEADVDGVTSTIAAITGASPPTLYSLSTGATIGQ